VATVQNTGSTAEYVQVVVAGIGNGGSHPFTAQSTVVLVAGGAMVNITVNTPAGTFTNGDIGRTFTFQARAYFGTSPTSLNNVSQDKPTGSFTAGP
jgi:hypothetical protein